MAESVVYQPAVLAALQTLARHIQAHATQDPAGAEVLAQAFNTLVTAVRAVEVQNTVLANQVTQAKAGPAQEHVDRLERDVKALTEQVAAERHLYARFKSELSHRCEELEREATRQAAHAAAVLRPLTTYGHSARWKAGQTSAFLERQTRTERILDEWEHEREGVWDAQRQIARDGALTLAN